jgi:iron(II)-dependent oxidoreductase
VSPHVALPPSAGPCPPADDLAALLAEVRSRTIGLLEGLDDAELRRPVAPFLSPIAWDLAHVAAFEELWLVHAVLEGAPVERFGGRLPEAWDALAQPRERRGALALPTREEALARLAQGRERTLAVLAERGPDPADPLRAGGYAWRMVAQHECQHQETILQALNLWPTPVPAASGRVAPPPASGADVDDEERVVVPAGACTLGTDDRGAAYDNERPRREATVATFSVDRHPVTARRWLAFIEDGGYRRPELWDDEGRALVESEGWAAPLGWTREGLPWNVRRFGHVVPLEPSEPVQHVSWHEAAAFARWAGARLPTEAEWEKAATWDADAGRAVELPRAPAPASGPASARWAPPPVGSAPRSPSGIEQALGGVYQWTASPFERHEGFVAFPYREYSDAFFGGPYRVLRGSSWAIGEPVARGTYRNWDRPRRRQLLAGLRLAWDPAGP